MKFAEYLKEVATAEQALAEAGWAINKQPGWDEGAPDETASEGALAYGADVMWDIVSDPAEYLAWLIPITS